MICVRSMVTSSQSSVIMSDGMDNEPGKRSAYEQDGPTALATAIGAYADAMSGTGVDLDEDFEAAALDGWTDLDDIVGDPASQP